MKGIELWVVGQHLGPLDSWALQGVFDSRDKAIAACRRETYFVAPITLNLSISDEQSDWPGLFYPSEEVAVQTIHSMRMQS